MAKFERERVTDDPTSGQMVYQPILEKGVFRFDCSENDSCIAFPSLSFVDTKVRDTPIMVHETPKYIPTFECLHRQQIITIQVLLRIFLFGPFALKEE